MAKSAAVDFPPLPPPITSTLVGFHASPREGEPKAVLSMVVC